MPYKIMVQAQSDQKIEDHHTGHLGSGHSNLVSGNLESGIWNRGKAWRGEGRYGVFTWRCWGHGHLSSEDT